MCNLQFKNRFDTLRERRISHALGAALLVAFIAFSTANVTIAQQTQNGATTIQSVPYRAPQTTPTKPLVASPSAISSPSESSFGSWVWMLFGGLFVSAVGLSTALFARVRKRHANDEEFSMPEVYKEKQAVRKESTAASAPQNGNNTNGDGIRKMRAGTNKTDHVINTWRTLATQPPPAKNAPAADNDEDTDKVAPITARVNEVNPFARAEINRAADDASRQKLTVASEAQDSMSRQTTTITSFGAFRIEQEVARLLEGEAHRLDVLTSRAPEDRRAIEATLMNGLNDRNASEESRRRARMALEEYGYVARRSAMMLCASDALERAAAARMLGEIKSPTALAFLLEALHDTENAVRVEAVVSIGSLALPSAIGALLDAARRHPEIPASVFQKSLSDCSVETEMYGDLPPAEPASQLISGDENLSSAPTPNDEQSIDESLTSPIASSLHSRKLQQLKSPTPVEPLPEWIEDESLYEALEQFQSPDIETRVTAAVMLAQFQVQSAIEALTAMIVRDAEPRVRAAAVNSLGAINHETVFKPVLFALADEAREVRAAGARVLSRLTFDRAEAYVRVLETFDETSLREVAHACAKIGLAAQALERINSPDPRQSYEACALLTLMAQGGYVAPLIQTVENHADINVRLAVAKLLGVMGNANVIEELRRVMLRGDMPDQVRATIMELVYNADEPEATKANESR